MAFARPAFEVPLHCETPGEFFPALKDTQRELRTGELVDRESRHVIRTAVGGFHEICDRDAREVPALVDKQLRQLRAQLEQGLKNGTIRLINGWLDFPDQATARHLEDLRSQCLIDLNSVLKKAGLRSAGPTSELQ